MQHGLYWASLEGDYVILQNKDPCHYTLINAIMGTINAIFVFKVDSSVGKFLKYW